MYNNIIIIIIINNNNTFYSDRKSKQVIFAYISLFFKQTTAPCNVSKTHQQIYNNIATIWICRYGTARS